MLFHFIRPWWLLALIPTIIVLVELWRDRLSQTNWQRVCDPHLLAHLLIEQTDAYRPWGFLLLSLAALLCILALAGPTWSHWPQSVYRYANARVIVLDVSPSMNAQDMKPSRLQRAKYKVLDLLNEIKEGQTGMIVFSRLPFVVSPLTEDSHTIASMVPNLSTDVVPVQGSNLSLAIKKAGTLLRQDGVNKGSIIIITDSPADHAANDQAKKMHEQGYSTYVMGVGTVDGAPVALPDGGFMKNKQGGIILEKLNVRSLIALAESGGGRYVDLSNSNADIKALLRLTDERNVEGELKETSENKLLWKDEGHWLIWLLLIIAAFGYRRGWWETLLS